ncbi:MAG: tetratricopeptide repeat protein [Bacteroidota bacterium]
MRKIIFFLSFNFFFLIVFSQNKNLNNAISYYEDYEKYNEAESLLKAQEKIDFASTNEFTKNKIKTWFYRGKIYLALFEYNLKSKTSYQNVSSAELDEALKSFQREIELDEKKNYTNIVNTDISSIVNHYGEKAYYSLINKNYHDAITFYEKLYEMKLKKNITDTIAINNMAFASVQIKDYKKAERYYNKLIELKYKPEKYFLVMIQMYNDAGDTASARKIIVKAVTTFPDNYDLMIEQINLFLKNGKSESAIQNINKALEKNPNNHELHLVLGQTYNKMAFPRDANNKELPKSANFSELVKKAEEEFNKALQLKPDYFVGLYSLGVFYNNMGANILKQSENVKNTKKVKAIEDKADALFFKAIPLLEKSHELDPTDKDTMRTLRQLYIRTGQGETEKYKKINEQLGGEK